MQRTKGIFALMVAPLAVCLLLIAFLAYGGIAAAEEEAEAPSWEHEEGVHEGATALTEDYLAEHDYTLSDGDYYLNVVLLEANSPILVNAEGNVSLCLFGGTLKAAEGQRAIVVQRGTLLLCDCSAAESGIITGAYAGEEAPAGQVSGGVSVESGAALVLRSGSLTGNVSERGTVGVKQGGTFSMYGGSIVGNTAVFGGGVYAEGGTFSMYGGRIDGNTALGDGGGIYGYLSSSVLLAGGEVTGNAASGTYEIPSPPQGDGGGVYIDGTSTFAMQAGNLSGNTAKNYGGGVYSEGKLTLAGGEIRSNTAGVTGGGICMYVGSMEISGDFLFCGNTVSGKADGLYISQDNFNQGKIERDSAVLRGGFLLDPVAGPSGAISVRGGYYPASAVVPGQDGAADSVCGRNLTSGYHLLAVDGSFAADADYAALAEELKSLVAYAVYTVGETGFSLNLVGEKIVYDGQPIGVGADFTVSVTRGGVPDGQVLPEDLQYSYFTAVVGEGGTVEKGEACEGAPFAAGTYLIDVSLVEPFVDFENKVYYAAAEDSLPIEIAKAVLEDGTADISLPYDGEPHSLAFALTGFAGEETFDSVSPVVEYSLTGEGDWSEVALTATSVADSKKVFYHISFANYETVVGDASITIVKATPVLPAAPAATVICGDALGTAEGLASGWVWNDPSAVITGTANTASAVYSLAEEDTENYDWAAAAAEAGWTYGSQAPQLECVLSLTVLHEGEQLERHAAVPSTCEVAGSIEYWQCTVCGLDFADAKGTSSLEAEAIVAPLAPHTLTHHAAVAPTCTADGTLEYWSCSVCGKNFADEEGSEALGSTLAPATGHALVHHSAAEATEEGDGNIEYWECSRCGAYFSDAQAKTPIEDKTSVVLPQITHTAEIIGLILGGAIILVLAIELALLIVKKRREEE